MGFIKSIFNVKGKVGNIVFKEDDGRLIIQAAPHRRTVQSEKLKASNSAFGIVQSLYKVVTASNDLKQLWRKEFPKRKGLNTFFIQKNRTFIRSDADVPNVLMSPKDNIFEVPGCEFSYENKDLILRIPKLDASIGLNPHTENFIEAAGFIHMYNRKESYSEPFAFRSVHSGLAEVQYSSDIILTLGRLEHKFESYQNMKAYENLDVFLVLISLTEADQPVRTSQKMRFPLLLD